MTTVAVIQARMGSTRLPGKVLESIRGWPLVLWTAVAVAATPGVDEVVVATTKEREDDPLVAQLTDHRIAVHRGSVHDVLRRVVDAAGPYGPNVVLRQTADNPFPDPTVMASQLRLLADGSFDYVGIAGLPLGIGAEVVGWSALVAADREATEPADREHVLPYVYARPGRFSIGSLPPLASPSRHGRYTVDTPADLAFARAVAERLPIDQVPTLADLEAVLAAEPELARLNAAIEQRGHETSELAAEANGKD